MVIFFFFFGGGGGGWRCKINQGLLPSNKVGNFSKQHLATFSFENLAVSRPFNWRERNDEIGYGVVWAFPLLMVGCFHEFRLTRHHKFLVPLLFSCYLESGGKQS